MASLSLFFLFTSIYFTFGNVCNIYEVTTSNPTTLILQGRSVGVYKRQHHKTCYGHPTFKHVLQDRYIYVSNGGIWMIGNQKNFMNCYNSGYFYRVDRPLPKLPDSNSWYYLNWVNKMWYRDRRMRVTCQCNVLEISTEESVRNVGQSEMLGVYVKNKDRKCNGHPIYMNMGNERHLFVGQNNRWTISDAQNARSCSNSVIDAYNPYQTSGEFPAKTGWMYFDRHLFRFTEDRTMRAKCVINKNYDVVAESQSAP